MIDIVVRRRVVFDKGGKVATKEQEVYIMAGELMEKFPGIEIGPDGRDSVTFGWDLLSHYNNGLLSWESAVRDAYQTLLEEAK